MTDESTDISVLKQLVLVARYVLPTGDVTSSFVAIEGLADGTAETIEAAIIDITSKKSVDVAKLRGFGSDGAPVMIGRRNDVAKRLHE